MTRQIVFIICLALFACSAFAHKTGTATGYFDNDELMDSLSYKFMSDSGHGPVYHCHMSRGNGKVADFSIPVAFESMQITECGKGCIETYQWETGKDSYEEYNKYLYNKLYNTWILKSTRTVQANGKGKTIIAKQVIGIDGILYGKKSKIIKQKR